MVLASRTAGSVRGDGAGGSRTRGSSGCGVTIAGCGATSAGCGVTIPVLLRLVHALAHGDTLEAASLKGLNHGDSQVESGELVDVVTDSKLAVRSRVGGIDSITEVVLSILDLRRSEVVVVIGVQVEVRDYVAKFLQNVLTDIVARRIRRAHVGGIFSENVTDCHLVLDHLVVDLSLGDEGKVLVRPGMGSDLVTFGLHALDDSGPLLIDSTLADVVTGNEEGGLESGSVELVKNLVSVDVWAIIVGDGNGACLLASIDTATTIRNTSLHGTSVVASRSSNRGLVGITARTVVE